MNAITDSSFPAVTAPIAAAVPARRRPAATGCPEAPSQCHADGFENSELIL